MPCCTETGLDERICPCGGLHYRRTPNTGLERGFNPAEGGGQPMPAFARVSLSLHSATDKPGTQTLS